MRPLAAIAAAAALWNLVQWLAIVARGVPIGYGEGAVVHAGQILARGGDPYAIDPSRFVSANYPPLGYVAVALGLPLGPFTGLRLANVVAACAIAALAYLFWRERARGAQATLALAVAILAAGAVILLRFDPRGVYQHLVVYNAFPYDFRNPPLLLVLAVLLLGGYVLLALRLAEPALRAYVAGAVLVVLLAGHEGATINYLLDLAAASCLALAASARAWPAWGAPVLAGQLGATLLLTVVGPFAPPSLDALAARASIARDMPSGAAYYAEDSAVLVAAGIEPIVDDSFVWARVVALGARADDVTPRVASRSFAAIFSDVPLDDLERASELERLRWPAELARTVLTHYTLDRSIRGAYRYVPRR